MTEDIDPVYAPRGIGCPCDLSQTIPLSTQRGGYPVYDYRVSFRRFVASPSVHLEEVFHLDSLVHLCGDVPLVLDDGWLYCGFPRRSAHDRFVDVVGLDLFGGFGDPAQLNEAEDEDLGRRLRCQKYGTHEVGEGEDPALFSLSVVSSKNLLLSCGMSGSAQLRNLETGELNVNLAVDLSPPSTHGPIRKWKNCITVPHTNWICGTHFDILQEPGIILWDYQVKNVVKFIEGGTFGSCEDWSAAFGSGLQDGMPAELLCHNVEPCVNDRIKCLFAVGYQGLFSIDLNTFQEISTFSNSISLKNVICLCSFEQDNLLVTSSETAGYYYQINAWDIRFPSRRLYELGRHAEGIAKFGKSHWACQSSGVHAWSDARPWKLDKVVVEECYHFPSGQCFEPEKVLSMASSWSGIEDDVVARMADKTIDSVSVSCEDGLLTLPKNLFFALMESQTFEPVYDGRMPQGVLLAASLGEEPTINSIWSLYRFAEAFNMTHLSFVCCQFVEVGHFTLSELIPLAVEVFRKHHDFDELTLCPMQEVILRHFLKLEAGVRGLSLSVRGCLKRVLPHMMFDPLQSPSWTQATVMDHPRFAAVANSGTFHASFRGLFTFICHSLSGRDDLSNVTLRTRDGGETRVHLEVLLSRSMYFLKMLRFGGTETESFLKDRVIVLDMSHSEMPCYVGWLYNEELDLSQLTLRDLLTQMSFACLAVEDGFLACLMKGVQCTLLGMDAKDVPLALFEVGSLVNDLPEEHKEWFCRFCSNISEEVHPFSTLVDIATSISELCLAGQDPTQRENVSLDLCSDVVRDVRTLRTERKHQ